MKRTWTIIGVRDVARSFGQLCDPPLMSPEHGAPGNGLLLFFRVDDFSMALKRAQSLVTRLEEEPRESERRDHGVCFARPGRVLRDDQRSLRDGIERIDRVSRAAT